MNPTFYQVFVLALATAAISVTVSKAKVFASVREYITKRNAWLGELVSCSYCISHWVALGLTALYQPILLSQYYFADFFVTVFAMVTIAALLIGLVTRLILFQANQPPSNNAAGEVDQLRNALKAARKKIIEQDEQIKQLQN